MNNTNYTIAGLTVEQILELKRWSDEHNNEDLINELVEIRHQLIKEKARNIRLEIENGILWGKLSDE